MPNPQIFNLPDVGEGLTEAEIVSWKVKPGDTVAVNDVIVEIETAKSLVELPSPFEGVVAELLVPEGRTVDVGTPIIAVAAAGEAPAAPAPSAPAPSAAPSSAEPVLDAGPLVGSGPKADAVKRRPRRPLTLPSLSIPGRQAPQAPAAPEVRLPAAPQAHPPALHVPPAPARGSAAPAGDEALPGTRAHQRGEAVQPAVNRLITRVLAKPPVRKAAKDLGIDLADITPTGRGGEVTKQDLLSYQAQRDAEVDAAEKFWAPSRQPQEERVERTPVRGIRKITAQNMVKSAFSAPHVSIFVDVDASRTMEFVKRLKASRDFEGIKVSPLLILAKAVIWAAARNPSVNATWSSGPEGDEILVHHYMNLGIAAATPRGLLVPNIKEAQDLSLKELAVALNQLASRAREGKTQPAEMQGGTLTITNIGA
ncbi:2-oxo acid dehydrogenase subunit E2, partial [Arthrobacter deserti]|nr:2-oxo acid dehydrogenase subunit E2 [Arthrobacter deserti]